MGTLDLSGTKSKRSVLKSVSEAGSKDGQGTPEGQLKFPLEKKIMDSEVQYFGIKVEGRERKTWVFEFVF